MFKYGSIEDELFNSMKKNLVVSQLESEHGFNKLARAIDYLNTAAVIFDKAGFYKEAEEVTEVLTNLTTDEVLKKIMDMDWKDQLSGGLADKKNPKDFDPKALKKGIDVEREHTSNPLIAVEITMDHLTEDPKYYDKLSKMEKE
jgi:hypothetical protein